MPTLTIEKSLLIEDNPLIDEFMSIVGASAERSAFYAAFRLCLEKIAAAANADIATTSTEYQSIPSKNGMDLVECEAAVALCVANGTTIPHVV